MANSSAVSRAVVWWLSAGSALLAWTLTGHAGQLGVSGAATTAAAQPTPGAQDQPGAVSGVVVDSVSGQPIGGAIVTIGGRGSGAKARSQVTDPRGRFIFADLLPADVNSMAAAKAGYSAPQGSGLMLGGMRPVSIRSGQWLADLKIELTRDGAISGTVVDERGEPVVGVRVRVLAQVMIAGRDHLAAGPIATTDDRGVYRISGLPEGRYVVSIPSVQNAVPAEQAQPANTRPPAGAAAGRGGPTADQLALELTSGERLVLGNYMTPPSGLASGQPQAYPIHFYPNALGIGEATPIALRPGQQRENVDFQLRPVRTWTVAGTVDGAPELVAGLILRLMPIGCEELGMGSEAATTVVGKDARFRFPGVPAGQYVILARPSVTDVSFRPQSFTGFVGSPSTNLPRTPGFASNRGGGMGDTGTSLTYNYALTDRDSTLWGRADIEVSTRDLTDVVVTMKRATRLSGRIQFEAASGAQPEVARGQAVAARGTGATPRTTIMAEPADGSPALGILNAEANRDNTFVLDGLVPGAYQLRVMSVGASGPTSVKSILWANADHAYVPFDASTGADISGVVITLIDKTQSLSGTVTDVAPARAIAVVSFPVDRARWTNFGVVPALLRATIVSGDGRYQMPVASAGEYYVAAIDESLVKGWRTPAFLEAVSRVATRVSVDWGETKSQGLRFSEVRR